MTSKRSNKAKGNQKKVQMGQAVIRKNPGPKRMGVPRQVFDRAAVEWANLLKDPCNAKLTFPCYPSGTGGSVLVRLESDLIVANGATETAAVGCFVPGASVHFTNATALTSDTLGSVLSGNSSAFPGSGFVGSSVGALRCVAACLQISYPGTELNRSGIVGVGVVPAETVSVNVATASGGGNININAQVARVACQHVERMPSSLVECRWFPGENDGTSVAPQNIPASSIAGSLVGRNAILWSASGFPVSTGVRIRTVAVFEVSLVSSASSGQVQAVVPPPSSTPTSAILKAMYDKDPQWYIDSAVKVGRTIGSVITYAKEGAKLAGAIAGGLALL